MLETFFGVWNESTCEFLNEIALSGLPIRGLAVMERASAKKIASNLCASAQWASS
jgi:hypothetical protein